ncbi:MAG TPA: hypothetical protein VLL51_04310 [Gemmatimonadales bacterium]|nr:hypothetical protein [Gemmatimonadales bacterium]
MTLELSTLGTVALRHKATTLLPGRRKVLAVLAYLAHVENPVDRGELAARFWPSSPEPRAKQSLRQALSELRTALGDALEITPTAVTLRRENLAVDSRLFLEDVDNELWNQALARWQGDFLAGFEDVGDDAWRTWLTRERASFTREFHRAREASGELPLPPQAGAQLAASEAVVAAGPRARDFSLGLLGTLSTDARAVIETAAVAGTRSPASLLRRVTSLSQAGFDSAMAELTSRGMLAVCSESPDCYEFAGSNTRLRVYHVTAAYRRQALHALIAEALDGGVGSGPVGLTGAAEHARLALPERGPARGRWLAALIGLLSLTVLAAGWYVLG